MQIRVATPVDQEHLRSLWNESNRELDFTPYPQSDFAPELVTDHIALVAEEDGAIIGTVYAATPSDEHGFVFGLYVIPSSRGRGVATALMVAVATELERQRRRYIVLSVDTPNASARAMYEQFGFVDQARVLRTEVRHLLDRNAGAAEGIRRV